MLLYLKFAIPSDWQSHQDYQYLQCNSQLAQTVEDFDLGQYCNCLLHYHQNYHCHHYHYYCSTSISGLAGIFVTSMSEFAGIFGTSRCALEDIGSF